MRGKRGSCLAPLISIDRHMHAKSPIRLIEHQPSSCQNILPQGYTTPRTCQSILPKDTSQSNADRTEDVPSMCLEESLSKPTFDMCTNIRIDNYTKNTEPRTCQGTHGCTSTQISTEADITKQTQGYTKDTEPRTCLDMQSQGYTKNSEPRTHLDIQPQGYIKDTELTTCQGITQLTKPRICLGIQTQAYTKPLALRLYLGTKCRDRTQLKSRVHVGMHLHAPCRKRHK